MSHSVQELRNMLKGIQWIKFTQQKYVYLPKEFSQPNVEFTARYGIFLGQPFLAVIAENKFIVMHKVPATHWRKDATLDPYYQGRSLYDSGCFCRECARAVYGLKQNELVLPQEKQLEVEPCSYLYPDVRCCFA